PAVTTTFTPARGTPSKRAVPVTGTAAANRSSTASAGTNVAPVANPKPLVEGRALKAVSTPGTTRTTAVPSGPVVTDEKADEPAGGYEPVAGGDDAVTGADA